MPTTIARSWKILSYSLLVVCALFGAWLTYHETRTPQNQREVLDRMIELAKERRYDKAVQVVQKWMNDGRRDSSHDGFLYQQIALVYTEEAYKKPAARAGSIRGAEANLEKALDFFDKKVPEDLDLDLFGIGATYQMLGNLSDGDKCRYYEKARQLFLRQLPLIKGDSYTAYGSTIPLEPLRDDIKKHLGEISEKSAQLSCQVR
jgi:tetratricopeptide (TPR) repeat protein